MRVVFIGILCYIDVNTIDIWWWLLLKTINKKVISIFLCFMLITILSSCNIADNNIENTKVKSNSGTVYTVVDDTDNEGEFSFSGISIKFSTPDELKSANIINYDGDIRIALNVTEAAQIGSSILEKCYEQWTEVKTVVVDKNQKADAWIVSGQLLNRNSNSEVGAVVFSIETGEVLYIGKGIPVS